MSEAPLIGPVPDPADDDDVVDAKPTDEPGSVLDRVRQAWAQEAEEHTLDLDVPGYAGLVVLRLGPLPSGTLGRLRRRLEASNDPDNDVNLNADVLIGACRAVLGRVDGGGVEELYDAEGPFRLDQRLAVALGMDAPTARAVVRSLFRHANDPDLAISRTAATYMEWAFSADKDVAEELLGES